MRKSLVLLAALALFATGCAQNGQDTSGDTPATPTEQAGENQIRITGDEYSFDAPSTVEGGFVQVDFKNNGKLVHEAAFVQSEPEASREQFIKDFKTAVQEGPIAAHLKPYFISEEVKAGQSATAKQSLPAGNYYLVCTLTDSDSQREEEGQEGGEEGGEERPELPQHFEQGMIKKVTVTGPATVELPESEARILAKETSPEAYTFDVTGLKAGKNEVLFRNDGPNQIHMAAVLEFPAGVDEAKAREAFSAGEGPPPPGTPEPEDVGFGGVFDVGGGSIFTVNLKRDRVYGIACFIQDRAGGPPHIARGMIQTVKIA